MQILSSKAATMNLIFECLKLREDLIRLEIMHNFDSDVAQKFFVKKYQYLRHIKELSFHKYQWYDERSEQVAEFLRFTNTSLTRLEFLNVNDYYKAISGVLESMAESRTLKELKFPLNGLGTDELIYILKWI